MQQAQQTQGVPLQVDYSRVAAHIRSLEPKTLDPSQYDDVITLLEYMRDELVQREAELNAKTLIIEKRERDVVQREKDVTLRGKAIDAAVKFGAKRRWWSYLRTSAAQSACSRTA